MEYRGNPSLPREIKERIQNTFEQTLASARQGSYQEALLGCDFILRLDPDYAPAKQLTERLQQLAGGAGDGDERVSRATQEVAAPQQAPPRQPAASAPRAGEAANLAETMQQMLAARQLKPLMDLAHQHQQTVLADPKLRGVVEMAQARLEAEPYVKNFLESAGQMLDSGQTDEAEKLIEKARSLDPSHPGLAAVEDRLAQATSSVPGAAGTGIDDAAGADDLFGEADPFSLDADPFGVDSEDDPYSLSEGDAGGFGSPAATQDVGFAAGDETAAFGAEELDPFSLDEVPEPAAVAPAGPGEQDDPFAAFGEAQQPAGPAGGASGDSRISELLAEGQAAFDQGEYQTAIDAWSRIFLIDIDHAEASRRIDQARKLKAEQERQTEEIFHEGMERIKAGDLEGAQEAFGRVLLLQPGHVAAQEYLRQLEAGEVPELTGVGSPPAADLDAMTLEDFDADSEVLQEEILIPPEPGERPKRPSREPAPAPPAKEAAAKKKFVLIGTGVLVLVALVALYLFVYRDGLFGNLGSDQEVAQTPSMPKLPQQRDPIAEARRLFEQGEAEQAINQLKLLAPDSPHHREAQELIGQWEATLQPELSADEAARRELLLAEAYQHVSAGEFLRAEAAFKQAAEVAPLEGVDANRFQEIQERLQPMSREIALFQAREWDLVLKDLWRLHLAEPGNRDVVRMIQDSYYNLGVQDLQRGSAADAEEKFAEVLELNPDDPNARRHYLFAQTYQEREPDLLYRIYVKYLPFR